MVVARGAHIEEFTNGLLFGPGAAAVSALLLVGVRVIVAALARAAILSGAAMPPLNAVVGSAAVLLASLLESTRRLLWRPPARGAAVAALEAIPPIYVALASAAIQALAENWGDMIARSALAAKRRTLQAGRELGRLMSVVTPTQQGRPSPTASG